MFVFVSSFMGVMGVARYACFMGVMGFPIVPVIPISPIVFLVDRGPVKDLYPIIIVD